MKPAEMRENWIQNNPRLICNLFQTPRIIELEAEVGIEPANTILSLPGTKENAILSFLCFFVPLL
jgi:hypothetical protein